MPPDVLAGAIQAARDGRLVVLAFTNAPWQPRGGAHGLYPGGRYAHTATLRVEGDQVVVHNTIMNDNARLRALFGGEVTATWPAERLEEFRGLQVGVALEIQLCGQPDCLSAPDRNPYGLNVYAPLNGISSVFAGSSVAPRLVAWPAVRLYVERPAGSMEASAGCLAPTTPPGGGSCGDRPNGGCAVDGTSFTATPCGVPANDVEGRKNWCCPADLCWQAGDCVQLQCPAECYRMACSGCAGGYGGCWCSPFPAMDFTCYCEAGDFRITGSSPTAVQPPQCP